MTYQRIFKKLYLFNILITLISSTLISCSNDTATFSSIALQHFQHYPQMQMQDFYKLTYQAAMGAEHLGADSLMLIKYLRREIAEISDSLYEQLTEEISPNGILVRLNLRPFRAKRGNPEILVSAILKSNQKYHSSVKKLEMYLNSIMMLASQRKIPYEKDSLKSFFNLMKEKSYPAVHHSDVYAKLYKPAYRVILKEFVPLLKMD